MPLTLKTRLAPCSELVSIILFIGVVALTLRLIFVNEVIMQNSPREILLFNGDSPGYLNLAHNLVYRGTYALPDVDSRFMALFRTPGYPIFCAVFEWMGFSPSGILLAQAFIGAFIPIGTVLLVNAILHNKFASFLAGLASALSPTGIGVAGILLTDLVFAATFIGGFLMLYYGIAIDRPYLSCAAGVVFGIAALIKPILLLWPIFSPIIWFLFARAERRPVRWKHIFIFFLLQVDFLFAWSIRNYLAENYLTFSIVGSKNLRHYVAARVEEWTGAGHNPSDNAIKRNQEIVQSREGADLAAKRATPADIARRQLTESFAIFRNYPVITIQVYFNDVMESLTSGWGYFQVQLPQDTLLGTQLKRLEHFSGYFRKLSFVLIAFALLDLSLPRHLRPDNYQRRYFETLVLILVIAYFAAFAGTTFWTGSRIMYPVEFAFISLSLAGVISLIRTGRILLHLFGLSNRSEK